MNIHYISHATLLIEAGNLKIVTDPWLVGPAYCGQWHLFPKPVNADIATEADVILLSHGHEDHLHDRTLRHMRKNVRAFYPYSWYGGIKRYMHSLGFDDVQEATTGRTYQLDDETSVTYIANNLDSIIVIEHGDEVVVNINDALHAHHPNVIYTFIEAIRKRWRHIDVLLCGYGGASFFPNAVHAPGKDDIEIAQTREQLFLHNFCRIVQALSPAVAIPFAADFALLAPWQRWINTTRIGKDYIAEYYRTYFDSSHAAPMIYPMYSGDMLHGTELVPSSPYRAQLIDGSLDHLLESQYATEIAMHDITLYTPEWFAEDLRRRLRSNIEDRLKLFGSERLRRLRFSVKLEDVARNNYYEVLIDNGEALVRRAPVPDPESILLIRTKSSVLDYSMASDWGGDAITIGYGAELFIFDEETIARGLDTVCVRLLTRHPSTTRHMAKEPIRTARFLMSNPITRSWALKQILRPSAAPLNPIVRKEWLLRTKCEICRACDLPMMEREVAGRYER